MDLRPNLWHSRLPIVDISAQHGHLDEPAFPSKRTNEIAEEDLMKAAVVHTFDQSLRIEDVPILEPDHLVNSRWKLETAARLAGPELQGESPMADARSK
jgi:hypothetical protein